MNHEVRDLYARLIRAWNDRDAEAFAACFDPRGDAVGFDGSEHDGPEALARDLGAIFRDHPTAAYVVAVRGVRELGPDVAILSAVAGLVPPGQREVRPDTNAIVRMVAVRRDGEWRIAQLTNTPARYDRRPERAAALTAELNRLVG